MTKYYERDYCKESDRTTTYEVTMNEETGEIMSIELIMWYQGRPDEQDLVSYTRNMKAIL